MIEWKEVEIGNLFERISAGKSIKAANISESGSFPVYGGNGLRGYAEESNFVGDCAIIGRQGAFCGNVRYFKGAAYMTEHAIVCVANKDNNTRFLSYLLGLQDLGRYSGQSAQPGLSVSFLKKQLLTVPPIEIQSRIASILTSLDDKIETNNKINAKLEEMAQALFKSWFVDFEPFKNGKFVESELGMIPEGWRVGKLREIATIEKRSTNPSRQNDTLFSHYSLPAFDDNKLPAKQYGNEIKSNKCAFTNKTTLLSKLNPYIKRIWYVDEVENNPICSTEFLPIKAKNEKCAAFLYSYLVSDTFYKVALSMAQGATNSHQRLDTKSLLDFELPINEDAMINFSSRVAPMLTTICNNRMENKQLSQLRDTLLPKLMNGEIEI